MSMVGASMLQKWNRQNPALMELSTLLQQRAAIQRLGERALGPSPKQYAVFIAARYRSIITNEAVWSGPFALALIKGEARKFAEQSVRDLPAPTEQELSDADAALKPYTTRDAATDFTAQPEFPILAATGGLAIYVALPALLAALLFRGGLVIVSLLLPRRGLPDLLAGTWPVPR